MKKLNIGGVKGHSKIEGWTVVDIRESADIALDISAEKLPFDDSSVDLIYCSHTLEHIYNHDLKFVLDEFYRVLKPAGIIRIVVPDIKKACWAYILNNFWFFKIKSSTTVFDKKAPIGGYLASWFYSFRKDGLGNGHVHCFDFDYLKYWLKNSSFRDIKKLKYKKSQNKEFLIKGLDLPRYKNESLYVECAKSK